MYALSDLLSQKEDPNQTQITTRRNLITEYPGETSTGAVSLETIKIHLNSVLSTPKAKCISMDISNIYLNTPLDRFEYMHIPYSNFLPDIIYHHNLATKVAADSFIYIKIRQAM